MHLSSEQKEILKEIIEKLANLVHGGMGQHADADPQYDLFHSGGVITGNFENAPRLLTNDYVVTKEQYGRLARYTLDKDLYLD